MAKRSMQTTWTKKGATRPGHAVKYSVEKPKGLSELADYLELAKPSNVLRHLRRFQEDWCIHNFIALAIVRLPKDKVKTIVHCSKCGVVEVSVKNV